MTRKLSLEYDIKDPIQQVQSGPITQGQVTVIFGTRHDQALELDRLVIEFTGNGRGIVQALATTADAFARHMLPMLEHHIWAQAISMPLSNLLLVGGTFLSNQFRPLR